MCFFGAIPSGRAIRTEYYWQFFDPGRFRFHQIETFENDLVWYVSLVVGLRMGYWGETTVDFLFLTLFFHRTALKLGTIVTDQESQSTESREDSYTWTLSFSCPWLWLMVQLQSISWSNRQWRARTWIPMGNREWSYDIYTPLMEAPRAADVG